MQAEEGIGKREEKEEEDGVKGSISRREEGDNLERGN